MNYIFKKHVRLDAERKELTAEADKLQKEFEEQMKQLQEKRQAVGPRRLQARHARYNQLEEQLNKEKATIQTSIQHKRREFIMPRSPTCFSTPTPKSARK